jgi:hypothetical protein
VRLHELAQLDVLCQVLLIVDERRVTLEVGDDRRMIVKKLFERFELVTGGAPLRPLSS